MKKISGWTILIAILLIACEQATTSSESDQKITREENPAAEGFDLAGSDARAIAIADSVMLAQGGRQKWDESRFFSWNFFGSRSLWWDKKKGDVRIEIPKDSLTILVNIHTLKGEAFIGDDPITHPDTLSNFLQQGKSIWINDAYWLFMPFKLKDTGVTLSFHGKDTTESGGEVYRLQLLFEQVGDTPQNKYKVLVDSDKYLVREWTFYSDRQDSIPAFTTPWDDYQSYNGLLLSGDRGKRAITNIGVHKDLPEDIFNSL